MALDLQGILQSHKSTTPHIALACWARPGGRKDPTLAGSHETSLIE